MSQGLLRTTTGLVRLAAGGIINLGASAGSTGSSSTGGSSSGASGTAQPLAIAPFAVTLCTTMNLAGIGGVRATGGLGAYTYTVQQTQTDVNYEVNAATGALTIFVGGAAIPARVDTFNVTVTDATGATATATCTATWQVGPVILPGAPLVFYNSQPVSGAITFVGVSAYGPAFNSNINVFLTDPTGNFTGVTYVIERNSTWAAPGTYPVAATATGTDGTILNATLPVVVLNDPGPTLIQWTQTALPLSSSRIPGTIVGQTLADGSPEYTSYSLSGAAAGKYTINGITGVLSVAGPLTAGADTITISASRSGITYSKTITLLVVAGVTLPAGNLTMQVSTTLTDFVADSTIARAVGQPVVTGITGTPAWTMQQPIRSLYDETSAGHGHPRYEIDPAAGAVTTRAQLSAPGDQLTISATDGINTCTATFPVPVAATIGPKLYVGQGMVAQYGAALANGVQGFEHWAECYALFQSPNATYAGAKIYIASNSDPNYYANDNGNALDPVNPSNYALRFGFHGPATLIGVQGTGGARPRMGGRVGSVVGGEGVDMGSKGFLVQSDADLTIQNIEFSDVHANGYQGSGTPESNSTGCAVRQNGNIWGNLTIKGCIFHDCDQGIETGDVACIVTLDTLELLNCGGCYVGSGATHNVYVGGCAQLAVSNVLSWKTINGHTFKSRAQEGTFDNCRFFDGEGGGASCQLEIPDGGAYTVSNTVFHKGAQPQNPNSVQFCAEMQPSHPVQVASLTFTDCTFICDAPTPAQVAAIYMYGRCLVPSGAYSTVTTSGCSFFGYGGSSAATGAAAFSSVQSSVVTGTSDGRPCAVTQTNSMTLTAQPALDFTSPVTGAASVPSGPFYLNYDGENRNNWVGFFGYEIGLGSPDLRVSVGASPVGTVLFTSTIKPCPYITGAPGYANPFASGAVWSIVAGAGPYTGGTYAVAPAVRYAIDPASGAVTAAQQLVVGVDNIILRCTSADGETLFQQGFYLVAEP